MRRRGVDISHHLCFTAVLRAGSDRSWHKQSDQWLEKIEPGGTVRVANPYGNIYARFGGYEGQVEILATTLIIDRSAPKLLVQRTRDETGLRVGVVSEGFTLENTPPRGQRKDRVDLVLFIPRGVPADLTTDDGEIATKGLTERLAETAAHSTYR